MPCTQNPLERDCCAASSLAAEWAEEAAKAAIKAAEGVQEAIDLAAQALEAALEAKKIRDMTAEAHKLPNTEDPTAEYDKARNVMIFGIPEGPDGPMGPMGPPPIFRGNTISPTYLPPRGDPFGVWFILNTANDKDPANGDLYAWNVEMESWYQVTNLRGPMGPAISVKGTKDTLEELMAEVGQPGDGWMLDGDLWVWSESTSTWVNVGHIQGPAGADGVPEIILTGEPGLASSTLPPGKYDHALAYVDLLGVYRYYAEDEDLPDGELVIKSSPGTGVWKLVIPSTDNVLGLIEEVTQDAFQRALAASNSMNVTLPGPIEIRAGGTVTITVDISPMDAGKFKRGVLMVTSNQLSSFPYVSCTVKYAEVNTLVFSLFSTIEITFTSLDVVVTNTTGVNYV